VAAGCLCRDGHEVVGVDPAQVKVDLINQGQTPVIEAEIGEIIGRAARDKILHATTDVRAAVRDSEMSMICVGTPSQLNGNLDLRYVRHVCEEIGAALRDKADFHVVVARSTMLPGTMRNVVIPTLEEASGKRAGIDFGVCNNPEFLREGTAVYDYYHPPKTVIGETDDRSGDILAQVYAALDAPLIRTDVETAEMVKYTDNVWHALKVGFANEIGNVCKAVGIDGHRVMEIFCHDTKLNLSPYYLKPGFAFGMDLDLPILNSIMPSNERQVERGLKMVMAQGDKKVGILGFSFKAGTDDLRESPLVEMIERLLGKGYDVRLFDRNVNIASLVGANRDYILNHIPHISKLMEDSIDKVLAHAGTIVIGNGDPEFKDVPARLRPEQRIVDLVRIDPALTSSAAYDGICW
jgi:GDP-mannose 6-dehydrogenase